MCIYTSYPGSTNLYKHSPSCSLNLQPIHALPMHIYCPVKLHQFPRTHALPTHAPSPHTHAAYHCICLIYMFSTCIHVVHHCLVSSRCCPVFYTYPYQFAHSFAHSYISMLRIVPFIVLFSLILNV